MPHTPISRRGFIEAGGALAATLTATASTASPFAQSRTGPQLKGLPLPPGVRLPTTPPRRKRDDSVGFAIIGLGGYALNQMMPRFDQADRAHISALVSGNPDKLSQVGEAYGVPEDARYAYEDFAKIAADDRIQAVYIVLPTAFHADFAIRAFAAGKHVLCEKPMALSSAECEAMIAAARRAGRKLMIAYRSHFEPYNVEAMRLMREKAVGDIRLIRSEQSYRAGPTTPAQNWRMNRALAGGGPLEDFGIYGLQSALYLTDEMPESISATTFQPRDDPRFTEIFAHVASQWRFPSGAVAHLATSYDSVNANFAHVRGTQGALIMDPATSYAGQKMRIEGQNARDVTPGDPTVQFARQLNHFTNAIRDGTPILTGGEMGLRDTRLIEAIYAAARDGRTVKLMPDGRMRG
ncbi:Gfo/Idh/MocA family oxidoreductase [Sphingomonas suaedae]|uniref:Gfo/Idh/MocA family oxidoreductase n=1 Tax=Sphingomonas suaedae TaxID=2599297 RepID=A0A518RBR5_9SPHN|nr:Gfo/Idh/MocA family oxidoreductase [Sphingomonas suaedae]QDX24801.1 Gfo/Idh/MocA family oxidoreductase [Sphingomonas suaedae]